MKRVGFTIAIAALALGVPGAALATHSGSQGGPREFAVGSAKNVFVDAGGPVDLAVSAHGPEPRLTGHVRGSGDIGGEFKVHGEVTCLRVEGRRASIKYRFDQAKGALAPFEGGGVQVFVEDNGPLGQPDANSTDFPQPTGVFETNARLCDDPNTRLYNPVDSGNYVVHDAP